jgi:hypothetical protein
MQRWKLLNRKHGLTTKIQIYNVYYGLDLLRCSQEVFQNIVDKITIIDILRLRVLADKEISDVAQLVEV